jgi:hypothetical protein
MMADNYSGFSFRVKCPSVEAASALLESLEDAMQDEDEPLELQYAEQGSGLEPSGDRVLIAHEKGGTNIEYLVEVLQTYLKAHDPEGFIGFAWADICSEPLPDRFGGGAVFMTATKSEWMSTGNWLRKKGNWPMENGKPRSC